VAIKGIGLILSPPRRIETIEPTTKIHTIISPVRPTVSNLVQIHCVGYCKNGAFTSFVYNVNISTMTNDFYKGGVIRWL